MIVNVIINKFISKKEKKRNYDACRKDWGSFSSVNIFNKIDIILLILANGPVHLATEFHFFPSLKRLNRRINSGRVYNFATQASDD